MGTSRSFSITGDIHGKVGPVVFLTWKGINVVRSAPVPPKKSKTTEKQRIERANFTNVQKFVASIPLELINLGYQLPRKSKYTASNLAFAYHRHNALAGETAPFELDLSKVRFTQPINLTGGAWNVKLDTSIAQTAVVSWELNPFPQKHTHPDDLALVIFYEVNKQYFFYNAVRRDELSVEFSRALKKTPAPDRDMHAWIFFCSADFKKVSHTKYLGNFIL